MKSSYRRRIEHTEFTSLLAPVIGLPITRPWRGYGSALFLEIGELHDESLPKPAASRAYELPLAIHTDNGTPLATQAIHELSYRNVWWMRLGILH